MIFGDSSTPVMTGKIERRAYEAGVAS